MGVALMESPGLVRDLLGAPAAEAVVTAAATAECYKIVLYMNYIFMLNLPLSFK
jgi:hypothetical protein